MPSRSVDEETDLAIALALSRRTTQSEVDSGYDEALARSLQEEELSGHQSTLGPETLPDHRGDARQVSLERTISERLAEASEGFKRHIPRTNSVEEPPCYDTFTSDKQRLRDRLEMYSLCEREVKGDGNCQFRALSDQLYRTPGHYAALRHVAVERMRKHPDMYVPYVEGDFPDYLRSMSKSGTWGDHLTLQAVADHFGLKIYIITSYAEGGIIEINPNGPLSQRVLYLSFWAEVHYNSVFPQVEPPAVLKKDKTLGSRRLYNFIHGEVY